MSFNHSEFFLWMTPFVVVLFYFWLTQKSQEDHCFSKSALEKLRVSDQTWGLKGRNVLFLIASLLIITALAEPVMRGERIMEVHEAVTIALDISKRPVSEFEAMKKKAIRLVEKTEGSVALVAYDVKVYRISPSSEDKKTLKELIANLSPRVMNLPIADEDRVRQQCAPSVVVVSGEDKGEARDVDASPERWEAIPLFYYPLGIAMLLIALALSSMSKRESVSLAFLVLLFLGEKDVHAGVMDFRLLDNAYSAYRNGEYAKSAELFGEYQRLHDSPEVRYNCANALFKSGKYEKARYWYERVVTDDPKLRKWVEINLAKLPIDKSEKPQKAEKKLESTVKKEGKKVEEVIQIQNTTPLFVY